MKLILDAYVRAVERYTLEIDAEYLKGLNDYGKKVAVYPEKWVDVNEQDIANVMNHKGTPKLDAEVVFRYDSLVRSETYTQCLGDWINDVVMEDVWCADSEYCDSETGDYDCYIG